jgi:hypothetical protein
MADELTDEAFEAAMAEGRRFERENPKASSVRYDAASGRLVIDFRNGSTLLVPARSLQDLVEASDDDLAAVELHRDYYLRWERLDVDFTVPGLMAGIFGTARFMSARREETGPRAKEPGGEPASGSGGAARQTG